MKRAILCEGKTDAIILSLFLATYNWKFAKKAPFNLDVDTANQTIAWFRHPGRFGEDLLIWAAGGITRLGAALADTIERTRSDSVSETRFERIAVVFDRDHRNELENAELVRGWVQQAQVESTGIQVGVWNPCTIRLRDASRSEHHLSLLPIVIPLGEPGDIELFLMNGLASLSQADAELAASSAAFITGQPDHPYLRKDRLRSKARLGTFLAVMSPDWVFGELEQKFGQVNWADLALVQEAFDELRQI